MTLHVIPSHTADHKGKRRKITCVTCNLKGCLGRCRFEMVTCPQPPKAA